MKTFKRSGDHSFHEIKSIPKGLKKVKHNKSYIFGVGEASNHNHVITMPKTEDMEIYVDDKGVMYFELKTDGILGHYEGASKKVADHKEIKIGKGLYVHVPEREVDLFSNAVRKVID